MDAGHDLSEALQRYANEFANAVDLARWGKMVIKQANSRAAQIQALAMQGLSKALRAAQLEAPLNAIVLDAGVEATDAPLHEGERSAYEKVFGRSNGLAVGQPIPGGLQVVDSALLGRKFIQVPIDITKLAPDAKSAAMDAADGMQDPRTSERDRVLHAETLLKLSAAVEDHLQAFIEDPSRPELARTGATFSVVLVRPMAVDCHRTPNGP